MPAPPSCAWGWAGGRGESGGAVLEREPAGSAADTETHPGLRVLGLRCDSGSLASAPLTGCGPLRAVPLTLGKYDRTGRKAIRSGIYRKPCGAAAIARLPGLRARTSAPGEEASWFREPHN